MKGLLGQKVWRCGHKKKRVAARRLRLAPHIFDKTSKGTPSNSLTAQRKRKEAMSQRRGRTKENVAGERYNSNALDVPGLTQPRQQQQPQMPDFMSAMGGMGGMPDMQQMMEMMQKGGMGGGMPGMPGMPGGLAGMMPNLPPPRPNILYPYGLAQGASVDTLYTFYPNYINSKKTVQEGRRILKELACEDPIADELSEVCVYLKLPHALEVMN